MARRKNAPESIRIKHGLSERLRLLRTEFYGERGGPDLARSLGIPVRTWYNYENGVTVPAEIILRVVELTSVEPVWLLRGEGPKFRSTASTSCPSSLNGRKEGSTSPSVTSLLRAALERLEDEERSAEDFSFGPPIVARREEDALDADLELDSAGGVLVGERKPSSMAGLPPDAMQSEWLENRRPFRTLRVTDDSMAPIVAEGARVAYADPEPLSQAFHDRLVVAWIEGAPVVRWFQHCGRFALLRAENPSANPQSTLVNLEGANGSGTFHRVLWISTPH
jgi:Peptidase S24-like